MYMIVIMILFPLLAIKKKLMNKNKYIGMRVFFFVLEGKTILAI